MININVNGNQISGSYGRNQFVVRYTKERYDDMMSLKLEADVAESMASLAKLYEEFAELAKESVKEMVTTKCPYLTQDDLTGEFFLTSEGTISSIPVPQVLVDRILESVEKGIDFIPIVKVWIRFLRNPKLRGSNAQQRVNFSDLFARYISGFFVNEEKVERLMETKGYSQEVAEKLSTVNDISFTQEGLLCTHKVVTEITTKSRVTADGSVEYEDRYEKVIDEDTGLYMSDLPMTNEERLFQPCIMGQSGDAYFVEGTNGYLGKVHYVKVGCVHRLPDWSYVNTNDDQSCVRGLHTGSLSYVKGYQHAGTETLDVLVDPMHIGAVSNGDNALRVLQYFVHGAWTGTNGAIYHSSTYAKLTDEEWARMRKEVVEYFASERKKVIDAQDQEIDEINAI
jgi:hypothetical protein